MTSALRLLKGRDGWWAILGHRVAQLPPEGVRPAAGPAGPEEWVDSARGRQLAPTAAEALRERGFFQRSPRTDYAVTVLTSTACNLGCDYCFQNIALPPKGRHNPPRIQAARLDEDLVTATADFVRRQQQAAGLNRVSLLIFGGEPLLNHPGCLRLMRALQPLGLSDAKIVTNGVLLTERKARQLHSEGLRRVQITFDGPQPAHDQVRVTRSGRPTYAAILDNVRAATAAVPELSWNFRVNVSHHNVDGLQDLVEDLAGISRVGSHATFHLALIDDNGIGYANDVGYDTDLATTFADVNAAAIRNGLEVPPMRPLGDCPFCGVVGGATGAVVNADGTLYSCWENAGRDGWEIGHVKRGYDDPATVARRWVACNFAREPHGSPEATRRFFDHVDTAALEEQRERRLLRAG